MLEQAQAIPGTSKAKKYFDCEEDCTTLLETAIDTCKLCEGERGGEHGLHKTWQNSTLLQPSVRMQDNMETVPDKKVATSYNQTRQCTSAVGLGLIAWLCTCTCSWPISMPFCEELTSLCLACMIPARWLMF